MKLTREEVLHIAHLARVALTEEEITRMSEQLSRFTGTLRGIAESEYRGCAADRAIRHS